jgi:hypothetical protein
LFHLKLVENSVKAVHAGQENPNQVPDIQQEVQGQKKFNT